MAYDDYEDFDVECPPCEICGRTHNRVFPWAFVIGWCLGMAVMFAMVILVIKFLPVSNG